jgi:hypothetical protein
VYHRLQEVLGYFSVQLPSILLPVPMVNIQLNRSVTAIPRLTDSHKISYQLILGVVSSYDYPSTCTANHGNCEFLGLTVSLASVNL